VLPVIWYKDRFDVLSHAAAIAPADGLVLEFGVASGATINHLAGTPALRERRIFGFDSFRGLPSAWANYPLGHFACAPPAVPANVELRVGLFAETLPPFLAEHAGPCALVHIDCDLYSSTRTVLDALTPRIVAGTVVALDEYWIVVEEEQRAFCEWLAATGRSCWHECRSLEQLVVMMK
jgi:Macrocin-O-methyltransferase (TylF)